jgi:hypothetical protein
MKKNAGLLGLISVFVCMLLIVSACGGKKADENPYAKLSKADMKYKNIQVANFTISPKGVAETDHPERMLAQTQSAVVSALVDARLFENVRDMQSSDRASSTLIIQAEMTTLRIVGSGARVWLGAMAGSSEMGFYVKLIDAGTGSVVAEKEIKDNANVFASSYTGGGLDKMLPSVIGNLITEFAVSAARK